MPYPRCLGPALPALLAVLIPALASAAADQRPNVILFIADDISWNDLGCTGNPTARTPHIDRLAANGRRFDAAFLTASSCSPSRSSLITGRYPHNNGRASELHQPIAAHLPWFPRLLREAGYYTALSGKHHMTSDQPAPGEAVQSAAFDLVDAGRVPGNSGGHGNWVKILRERPRAKPFFLWYASYDAHRDWDGDAEWVRKRGHGKTGGLRRSRLRPPSIPDHHPLMQRRSPFSARHPSPERAPRCGAAELESMADHNTQTTPRPPR